jgi:hypothetical protein
MIRLPPDAGIRARPKRKTRIWPARSALLCLSLLSACERYSGPGTTSEILASRPQYFAGSPELTLRAAAFARLQGLTLAEAISVMEQDSATCSGSRCVWSVTRHPAMVEIGPIGAHLDVATLWSVTVLKNRIENENDLLAAFQQQHSWQR